MPVKANTDKSYIYALDDGSQYTEKMAKDLVHLYETGEIQTDDQTIQALTAVNAIVPYMDSYHPTLTADKHLAYFRELGIEAYWEEDTEYADKTTEKLNQQVNSLSPMSIKKQQRRERIKRQFAQKMKQANQQKRHK